MTAIITEGRSTGAEPWPLGLRLAAGMALPGGPAMADEAVDALGLGRGDRLVELAPGLGLTSRRVFAREPGTWTGVEPDAVARERLERVARGPGRRVVDAPLDATGLEDGAATAVLADAVLSTLSPEARAATLREAARLLRAGGRLALHEIAAGPADGAGGSDGGEPEGAIHPPGVAGWRAALEDAGLVVTGSLEGPLRAPSPGALMREAGPRAALAAVRGVARGAAGREGLSRARRALAERPDGRRAVVLVAEKPLVLGLRRPRL